MFKANYMKFWASKVVGAKDLRNVGKDGTAVLDIYVYGDKSYREKNGGIPEGTYLPNVKITLWGQVAEQTAQQGIAENDLIFVAGEPDYTPYEKDGELRQSFTISVNRYDDITVCRHAEAHRKGGDGGDSVTSTSSTSTKSKAAKQAAEEDAIPF